MRIYVGRLVGPDFDIEVEPTDRIDDIREKIQAVTGTPPDQQRILYKGRQLDDGNTLQDYGIQKDDRISIVLRLRG
jgi:ubiquitin